MTALHTARIKWYGKIPAQRKYLHLQPRKTRHTPARTVPLVVRASNSIKTTEKATQSSSLQTVGRASTPLTFVAAPQSPTRKVVVQKFTFSRGIKSVGQRDRRISAYKRSRRIFSLWQTVKRRDSVLNVTVEGSHTTVEKGILEKHSTLPVTVRKTAIVTESSSSTSAGNDIRVLPSQGAVSQFLHPQVQKLLSFIHARDKTRASSSGEVFSQIFHPQAQKLLNSTSARDEINVSSSEGSVDQTSHPQVQELLSAIPARDEISVPSSGETVSQTSDPQPQKLSSAIPKRDDRSIPAPHKVVSQTSRRLVQRLSRSVRKRHKVAATCLRAAISRTSHPQVKGVSSSTPKRDKTSIPSSGRAINETSSPQAQEFSSTTTHAKQQNHNFLEFSHLFRFVTELVKKDVIFVSVDCDGENIGIATLDTRDIRRLQPKSEKATWVAQVSCHHIITTQHDVPTNKRYVNDGADHFRFGSSVKMERHAVAAHIRDNFFRCIDNRPLDNTIDEMLKAVERQPNIFKLCTKPLKTQFRDVIRRLVGSYAALPLRQIVLVGYDLNNDIKVLRSLGFDSGWESTVIERIDTQKLSIIVGGRPRLRSLDRLLAELKIVAPGLHNAGNDAKYTLHALIALAALPDSEFEQLRSRLHVRSTIEQWTDDRELLARANVIALRAAPSYGSKTRQPRAWLAAVATEHSGEDSMNNGNWTSQVSNPKSFADLRQEYERWRHFPPPPKTHRPRQPPQRVHYVSPAQI